MKKKRKYTADDRCCFCGATSGAYTSLAGVIQHVVCYPCLEEACAEMMREEDHRGPQSA